MIAAILAEEMWYVMNDNELFNPKRYAKKLSLLPDYLEAGESKNTTRTLKAEPAIGRNEPCKCGSGKKFKKCCGLSNNKRMEQ
ncbi:SEC-C domain-containing protein [Metabacillus sp. KIGAM252]|uniref:SEC-C domain-containing protein n=2 Tax=Metabacillus flavus TaxID=2823519 RepID=A0ABS5LA59_9BACI|nr:SEC-C domain-containing protein [Metabacillus flavus]